MFSPPATASVTTALVWFRRDLRLHDHRALARALTECERVVPVFVYDDAILGDPLTGSGRVQYLLECLADLDRNLRWRGAYLVTRRGVPHEELYRVCREAGAGRVFYHEDTDRLYGRERDEALRARLPGIDVVPVPDSGVFFAPDARRGWARKWEARMAGDPIPAPGHVPTVPGLRTLGVLTLADLGLPPSDKERVTPGGETWARGRLDHWLRHGGGGVERYRRHISVPYDAERGRTSRLSAPLSLGVLSPRAVVQSSLDGQARDPDSEDRRQWHSRLYWRDHFTQKLRDWPRAQFDTLNPAYAEIRQTLDPDLFDAWTAGRTGYPLVDASMRALARTGFLNFRMRAMVASFWSYLLWQPWQAGAEWFQKHLIDYDTGINCQQWQMQSGNVGHHANRIYDPTAQVWRCDPLGLFVARYVPELAAVPMPLGGTTRPILIRSGRRRPAPWSAPGPP
jgi:deoxyribodipyrimidine photo-lyase